MFRGWPRLEIDFHSKPQNLKVMSSQVQVVWVFKMRMTRRGWSGTVKIDASMAGLRMASRLEDMTMKVNEKAKEANERYLSELAEL